MKSTTDLPAGPALAGPSDSADPGTGMGGDMGEIAGAMRGAGDAIGTGDGLGGGGTGGGSASSSALKQRDRGLPTCAMCPAPWPIQASWHS